MQLMKVLDPFALVRTLYRVEWRGRDIVKLKIRLTVVEVVMEEFYMLEFKCACIVILWFQRG